MHRIALGVLTAALALLVAALGAPSGNASTATAILATAHTRGTTVPFVAVPVHHSARTGACRSGLVALTFDDGPSATVTAGLVHTLVRLKVPATFFMVGSRLRTAPAAGKLVGKAGFVIGNHTWSHPQLIRQSDAQIMHELRSTRREMRADGLVPSNLMRPPYGDIDHRVRVDIRKLGLVAVLWTIDSRDWAGGQPQQIAHAVLSHLRPNQTNIVLQHDGVTNSPNSARAVPMIVSGARKRGYCFTDLGSYGGMAVPVPRVRATVLPGTEDGPTPIKIRLDLDRATTRAVSLRVRTTAGTATDGSDFTPVEMVVTFPRGVRSAWFSIPVHDDALVEPVEDLHVLLDQPHGVTLTRSAFLASILSND